MRRAIFVLSAAAFVFGFAAADAMAAPPTQAQPTAASGLAWCGFKDKQGSRVRCGFSNETDCKQAVGEPGAVCIVDPYLTEDRRDRARHG